MINKYKTFYKKLLSYFLLTSLFLTLFSFSFALESGNISVPPVSISRVGCLMFVSNLKYGDGIKNVDLKLVKFGPDSQLYKVIELQNTLSGAGYLNLSNYGATGYFGINTFKAVKKYQKVNNINPTGFVGEKTRTALRSEFCGNDKIKDCPSEKIVNYMPVMCIRAPCPAIDNSYYIYNGVRKEISDFDANYVKNSCNVKETIVY